MIKTILENRNRTKAINSAFLCNGWTSKPKLNFLYEMAMKVRKVDGDILEIGSAWGRSTVLLGIASQKKIISIDPHTGGIGFIKDNKDQASYDEFIYNLKQFDLLRKVDIYKKTTDDVIDNNDLPNSTFALAFIDGLHTAEGVETDINFTLPKMNSGSIVIFDDYYEPTVIDMKIKINELLSVYDLEIIQKKEIGLVYVEIK